MGKSQAQKNQERINLQVAQAQADQSRQQAATQQALLSQQQQIYGQISPFAQSAIGVGNEALQGRVSPGLVNAFLQPAKSALTSSYDQGRQNLLESLASQGVYGSGLGATSQAAFERSQARDIGNLTQQANSQALQTALGLGFQGANILQGQQGIFNPVPYGQLGIAGGQVAMTDPRQYARAGSGLLGGLAGAGLGAIGNIYGRQT